MTSGDVEQDAIIWQYALNASWVLLPLVPAVLIYLIFPRTETSLGGPFAGLTIRSSGAFAAYFIVLLATYPLLNRMNDNIESRMRPSWTIEGSVRIEDENGDEIDYASLTDSPLEITLVPSSIQLTDQKTFNVIMPPKPKISVRFRGFGTHAAIDAERPPEGLNVVNGKKLIEITSPLVIRKTPCVGIGCAPQS